VRKSRILTVLSEEELTAAQAKQEPPKFTGQGIKVGVLAGGYGASAILTALQGTAGVQAQTLHHITPEMLAPCQVAVVPQPRAEGLTPQERQALAEWVRGGGGLLVTHDLVGYREDRSVFPEVSAGAGLPGGTIWRVTADHPVTAGLPKGKALRFTYYDAVTMKQPQAGTVVATTPDGAPVVIAAQVGKGRYVANGMALGLGPDDGDAAPTADEVTLLVSAVKWLATR
jgi:hypothetical protein